MFIPIMSGFDIKKNNERLYDFMRNWAKVYDDEKLYEELDKILEEKQKKYDSYDDKAEIKRKLYNLFSKHIAELYSKQDTFVVGFDIEKVDQ
ncbi:MAG: hypothetical protein ACOCT9_03210 [archaeon]